MEIEATPPANWSINYTTTDHLGSPRIITEALGQVISLRDSLPFGEEIGADPPVWSYYEGNQNLDQFFVSFTDFLFTCIND